eukprot:scaffold218948_cov28-Tisochrysis_lutea.AAC.1
MSLLQLQQKRACRRLTKVEPILLLHAWTAVRVEKQAIRILGASVCSNEPTALPTKPHGPPLPSSIKHNLLALHYHRRYALGVQHRRTSSSIHLTTSSGMLAKPLASMDLAVVSYASA